MTGPGAQASSTRPPAAGDRGRRPARSRLRALTAHPIATATATAVVLQVVWWAFLANSGGDIAAQDAWADFARKNPGKPYDFAHYGGIHQVSYSVISPYIMAGLGVRTTMILASAVSTALLALILVRSPAVRRPLWPALVGSLALFGNSISGRTTFVLGMAFALGAVAVVFVWPDRWRTGRPSHRWARGALVSLLTLLATFGSPVDGLFLGLLAAGLWLQGRRAAAYAVGIPPVIVVVLSKLFFPLPGVQPMHWPSVILPMLMALFVFLTAPRGWRVIRMTTVVYVVAVLFSWLVPTPIGTNVTRLGLIFGGVALTAVLVSGRARSPLPRRLAVSHRAVVVPVTLFASLALATSGVWQVATAAHDLVHTAPDPAWNDDTKPLVAELGRLHADTVRIEVVPTASHREVSALSQFVQARGWNRQVDNKLNAEFYDQDDPLTAPDYRRWLHAWAVAYVVVPPGTPDNGSLTEVALIRAGLPYLRRIWSDPNWAVYKVRGASPTVSGGGTVVSWDEGGIWLRVPRAGSYVIREKYSRHMVLVDQDGTPIDSPDSLALNRHGCVLELKSPGSSGSDGDSHSSGSGSVDTSPSPGTPLPGTPSPGTPSASPDGGGKDKQTEQDLRYGWTVLLAPAAGLYRLTSLYTHSTACPDE